MFGLKRKSDQVFMHAEDCRIVAADPGVQIPWNEVSRGHFVATCACGEQHDYAPVLVKRTKIDPLDPQTARHLGQYELANERDPVVLERLAGPRRVRGPVSRRRMSECECNWQVPLYAESVG